MRRCMHTHTYVDARPFACTSVCVYGTGCSYIAMRTARAILCDGALGGAHARRKLPSPTAQPDANAMKQRETATLLHVYIYTCANTCALNTHTHNFVHHLYALCFKSAPELLSRINYVINRVYVYLYICKHRGKDLAPKQKNGTELFSLTVQCSSKGK